MDKRLNYLIAVGVIITITFFFFDLKPAAAAKLPKGSTVGNVVIEGLNDGEVKKKLNEEIELWKMGDDLILKSDFEKFTIPRHAIEFDVESTFSQIKERTKRHYSNFFLGQKNVHIPFQVYVDENVKEIKLLKEKDYINDEKTLLNVIELANELNENTASIIYNENKEIELDVVAKETIDIPDNLSNAVITYAIKKLDGEVIGPNDAFSFIKTVELPEKMTRSEEELSFLASAFYSLMLKTNFDIVSRETALHKPSYIDDGLDVYVNPKEKVDFIIYNPNELSFKVNFNKNKDKLEMTVSSHSVDLTYDYEIKNKKQIEQRTLYRYSHRLAPGQSEVIDDGEEGFIAEVYRNSFNKNDVLIDTELISKEFSLPKPKIVLVSSESPETSDESSDDITEENIEDFIDEEFRNLIDLEVEKEKVEKEINEFVNEYIDELNKQMVNEFDDYVEQFINILQLIDDGEVEKANKEIEKMQKQIEESEKDSNNFFYKLLFDLLTTKIDANSKEE